MRRQSAPLNLRDREIQEILDEDRKYYRQVLEREFKQVRLMSETYVPPNIQEKRVAFNIDKYFLILQQESDKLLNALVAGTVEDATGLFNAYQELITYLLTYGQYGTLGQRDLAVIENKFDAIAPQIEQIATAYSDRDAKQARELIKLASILDNRHYVLLRSDKVDIPEPIKQTAKEKYRQRVEAQRERVSPLESGSEVEPLAQMFRASSARERTPFLASTASSASEGSYKLVPSGTESEATSRRAQWAPPPQPSLPAPNTKAEAKDYVSRLTPEEWKQYSTQLGINRRQKAATKDDGVRIYLLKEQGLLKTPLAVQRAEIREMAAPPLPIEDDEEMIEYGNEGAEGPQSELEGDGRRRDHGFKIGAGEAEDMMFGLPAGMEKAMFLRPMDRRPVHFKTADERKEVGLSLEDRMSFLNQLDSKPVKEELKINSIHTYKKGDE